MPTTGRRVAVVTGSNKGIGYAIVRQLVQKFDGDVILTARDEQRGLQAVEQIESEIGRKPLFHLLDIDDQDSIIQLKNYLEENYGGLDVLVNNAAIAYKHASTAPFTEQAINTLKTNFHSNEAVCDVLFRILRPGARVVNLSSSCGMLKCVHSPELRKQLAKDDLTREELNNLAQKYIDDVHNGNVT